jgi:hypothetical protein
VGEGLYRALRQPFFNYRWVQRLVEGYCGEYRARAQAVSRLAGTVRLDFTHWEKDDPKRARLRWGRRPQVQTDEEGAVLL